MVFLSVMYDTIKYLHFIWIYTFPSAFVRPFTQWHLHAAHSLFAEHHSMNAIAFTSPHSLFAERHSMNAIAFMSPQTLFAEHHSMNAMAFTSPHTLFAERHSMYAMAFTSPHAVRNILCICRYRGLSCHFSVIGIFIIRQNVNTRNIYVFAIH